MKNKILVFSAIIASVGALTVTKSTTAKSVKSTAIICRSIEEVDCGRGSSICQVKILSTGQTKAAYFDTECAIPIIGAQNSAIETEYKE